MTEKDTLSDEEILTSGPGGEPHLSGDDDDSTDSDSDTGDDADDTDADSDDMDA